MNPCSQNIRILLAVWGLLAIKGDLVTFLATN